MSRMRAGLCERYRVQFRWEAFHGFNTPQFGIPGLREHGLGRENVADDLAFVRNRDRAGACEQVLGRVDAESGVNGGMEIGDADLALNDLLAEVVGLADDTTGPQTATGEDATEGFGL